MPLFKPPHVFLMALPRLSQSVSTKWLLFCRSTMAAPIWICCVSCLNAHQSKKNIWPPLQIMIGEGLKFSYLTIRVLCLHPLFFRSLFTSLLWHKHRNIVFVVFCLVRTVLKWMHKLGKMHSCRPVGTKQDMLSVSFFVCFFFLGCFFCFFILFLFGPVMSRRICTS